MLIKTMYVRFYKSFNYDYLRELAPLVDRARGLGGDMTGDTARERELLEQALQAFLVAGHARVHLAVGAVEVGSRDRRRAAMTRAHHVHQVEIARRDHPVEMRIDEGEPGVVPQWPSSLGLTCSGRRGRRRRGLSIR